MPLTVGAIAGGANLISGLFGQSQAASQRAQALAAQQAALQKFLDANVPDPAQQQVIMQKFQSTGQLDPQMEAAINQQSSAMNGVSLNADSMAAENSALSKLADITSNNGMDAQEKDQAQQLINNENSNTQGAVGAILQNANARGVGGSGASLAAELAAQQNSANNANSNAMGIQAQASQRALSALAQQGSQASNITNQNAALDTNKAAATDAINKFNTANQQNVANTNVQTQNQAQATNLANQQAIANSNTQLTNQQEMYNKQLIQQQYEDKLQQAAGASGQYQNQAAGLNTQANATAGMWSGIGNAVSQGVAAGYKYNNSKDDSDDSEE